MMKNDECERKVEDFSLTCQGILYFYRPVFASGNFQRLELICDIEAVP